MKMSEGVEWSLHCLTLLAVAPARAVLSGKALAEFHDVSESYLLKHLKALAKAGLLQSVAGAKGGYRLGRPADTITALDVVDAVEGSGPSFRCAEIRKCGPAAATPSAYRTPCGIHKAMAGAEQAWRQALRDIRLSDLVAGLGESVPSESVAKAQAWLKSAVRY